MQNYQKLLLACAGMMLFYFLFVTPSSRVNEAGGQDAVLPSYSTPSQHHTRPHVLPPLAVEEDMAVVGAPMPYSAKLGNIPNVRMGRPMEAARPTPRTFPDAVPLTRDGGVMMGGEDYATVKDNAFVEVLKEPLSTFSADVDTASYTNVRRLLNDMQLPPSDAVRIEEMLNYFDYQYASALDGSVFSITKEVHTCPWNKRNYLMQLGIKAKEIPPAEIPPRNLVFLLDVSGSMSDDNRLPLLKASLAALVDTLRPQDKVSIVVYASQSGLHLDTVSGDKKDLIKSSINSLVAAGSTNGGEGLELAYKVATASFIEEGINRIIIGSDGDFNVGMTDNDQLTTMIKEKAAKGIYITVLGFGMGNYKDSRMEALADKGNGNYFYIDNFREAHRVLVQQSAGTLNAVAKDVKMQIEFNPKEVSSYRLIGYENRVMESWEFNDDSRDAGELGAGHTVTVLYEIVPNGNLSEGDLEAKKSVDDLIYQSTEVKLTDLAQSGELATVKIRYKIPASRGNEASKLSSFPVTVPSAEKRSLTTASNDFKFASAVASFGMVLRNSPHKGDSSYDSVSSLAKSASKAFDPHGKRDEFLSLIVLAKTLS